MITDALSGERMTILNHLPKLRPHAFRVEGLKPHRHYHVCFDGVEDPKKKGLLHDVRGVSSSKTAAARRRRRRAVLWWFTDSAVPEVLYAGRSLRGDGAALLCSSSATRPRPIRHRPRTARRC